MFVRIKTKKQEGKEYSYLQIVENRRIRGKVRQKVIGSLGRVDNLKREKIDGLIKSLKKYADKVKVLEGIEKVVSEWARR